jgi:hypothetical protein
MTLDLDPLSTQRALDFDKLKAKYPALYKSAVRQTGKTTGIHKVDVLFPEGSHKYILECSAPLPDIAAPKPVVPAEPQIDMGQLAVEEQADIQRRADAAAATNRLDQYAAEQGLENTDANFALIKKYVAANTKDIYWSEQIIDLAVQALRDQLTWKVKEAAPPAPAEVLGQLADGTTQLALDTKPTKQHSTLQLKDWLKRTNANRIIRPSGSFRSSF